MTIGPSNVRAWLSAPHHSKQLALLDQFEMELRLGRLAASTSTDRRAVTVRTVELLKIMIGGTRWRTPAELLQLLRGLGRELQSAGGLREPAIGNVVRRILAAVREEVVNTTEDVNAKRTTSHSLESMLWALPQHVKPSRTRPTHQRSESFGDIPEDMELPPQFYQPRPDLKQSIMEAIQEITSELEDLHKNINDQATNHIHAGEIVLTYGSSRTVKAVCEGLYSLSESDFYHRSNRGLSRRLLPLLPHISQFLKAAVDKKLRFTVVICEGAPWYQGHDMAQSLAQAGIEVVCIPDSAIFAMMARVNKVILPAHAVLANGGLIAHSGCNLVALAAAQNSVPVVCLTGMFKLTPLFPHDGQDTLNDLLAPPVDYAQYHKEISGADIVNPVHDYIKPELINLYVTNVGSFQPSYIYRLLAEYYHSDDWKAFQ